MIYRYHYPADPLAAARGIVHALIGSAVLWTLIALAVWAAFWR